MKEISAKLWKFQPNISSLWVLTVKYLYLFFTYDGYIATKESFKSIH